MAPALQYANKKIVLLHSVQTEDALCFVICQLENVYSFIICKQKKKEKIKKKKKG